ncbi:hypothetical protein BZG21_39655, partial [Escherichia coli]|nr:hypothetical protein [Escherichia coli]
AFLEAAKRFARGGFDVIIDGIVGPWFLEPWLKAVQDHYEVHYIILRATRDVTMKRAINRTKLDKNSNMELVEKMWEQFNNLGRYESNIIDTTNQSIEQSVSTIKAVIEQKTSLLTI